MAHTINLDQLLGGTQWWTLHIAEVGGPANDIMTGALEVYDGIVADNLADERTARMMMYASLETGLDDLEDPQAAMLATWALAELGFATRRIAELEKQLAGE